MHTLFLTATDVTAGRGWPMLATVFIMFIAITLVFGYICFRAFRFLIRMSGKKQA